MHVGFQKFLIFSLLLTYIQCGYCKYISLGIFEAVLQHKKIILVFIETGMLQTKM